MASHRHSHAILVTWIVLERVEIVLVILNVHGIWGQAARLGASPL
jgi:hypothetical protein